MTYDKAFEIWQDNGSDEATYMIASQCGISVDTLADIFGDMPLDAMFLVGYLQDQGIITE